MGNKTRSTGPQKPVAKKATSKPPTTKEGVESEDEGTAASSKRGRQTLWTILNHTAEREAKSDALIEKLIEKQMEDSAKSKRQMWMLALALVLGLLGSVGVASAVKWGNMDLKFGPQHVEPPSN